MLNKLRGVVTTLHDPEGRKTVAALVVGRLDYNSEGLLLLTNDRALTHALTHPSRHIAKTYIVEVMGNPRRRNLITCDWGYGLRMV